MKVRRLRETDAWHWRQACSSWPTDNRAEELTVLPRGARLCSECATLDLESALDHLLDRDRKDRVADQSRLTTN